MAKRREDIVAQQRAQIAMTVMSPYRPWGTVQEVADRYGLSRQAVYEITAKGRKLLQQALTPGRHGPQARQTEIVVTKNRIRQGVLTLTENGVSQRGVMNCLAALLNTPVSLGWVNGELAKLEASAKQANDSLEPTRRESVAGDEIFSQGQPNLLVVGNESLYIYALTRQDECDGDTWGCVLLEIPSTVQFSSDAGPGLAVGAKAAGLKHHQLGWDHLLRPMWGQGARLERQAYAALAHVEERKAKLEQTLTPKRRQQHLYKWAELVQKAEEKIEQLDAFYQIAREVDDWFALIDLETGQLKNAVQGSRHLRYLGQQVANLSGRIYQKLATKLKNWAIDLFSYQFPLRQALTPLKAQYGVDSIAALCRIWQCEADEKRRRLSIPEQLERQQIWRQSLDEAYTLLGDTWLWQAWEALSAVLGRSWRGSMLVECVNSLLRPVLDRRKHTDQGCLELFRFLHNVRPFLRGKRVGHSPAQLVGITLPDYPLSLLGLAPEVSS